MERNKLLKNFYIKRKEVVWALLLNLCFLIFIILFCDMKYEVSDDFIMAGIVSGAYGNGYNPHLLFSNIIIGYILVLFYKAIPIVSWYFVGQILLCYTSFVAITYVIFKKNNKWIATIVSLVFISYFSDDVYVLVQFTKTASLAMAAGGVLLLNGLYENGKKQRVLGSIIFIIGSMIRFLCISYVVPFLLIAFCGYAIDCKKEYVDKNSWRVKITKSVVACMIVVGVAIIFEGVNTVCTKMDDKYKTYSEFTSARAHAVDSASCEYEMMEDDFQNIGITENEYLMIRSWNFSDETRFDATVLRQVGDIKVKHNESKEIHIRDFISKLFDELQIHKYHVAQGLLVLCFLALFDRNWKKHILMFLSIVLIGVFYFYFYIVGRIVYRVEFGLFVASSMSIVSMIRIIDYNLKLRT